VTNAVENRWIGRRPLLTGLYAPQYCIAMMMDPTTAPPTVQDLPYTWQEDCEKILKRFYSGTDYLSAKKELFELADHADNWGEEVMACRSALDAIST
jgi:hypothetical protein